MPLWVGEYLCAPSGYMVHGANPPRDMGPFPGLGRNGGDAKAVEEALHKIGESLENGMPAWWWESWLGYSSQY